ncbi:ankyrin [Punctularia strigosozonata HHB-11173 SS5]|uniref:ankyrin n=1 Tax=Punctularia strigosozonata (strain HHB-11173) TaxID=741275 RepID=UPI0004416D08|nr:ankyrin [Punctularia strigosozonata HHB-11173 SS5]EIN14147.1 ankyrin [Punctularia strigosozonata HHB-11173 SS5]
MGRQPTTSRPGLLDFAGRAKWDSWKETGAKYASESDVEQRYIDLARQLGWIDGTPLTHGEGSEESEEEEEPSAEELLARESDSEENVASDMGKVMSTIVSSEEEASPDLHSLHGLALNGDQGLLEEYLHANPDINVNERDEHGYSALHLACDRGHAGVVRLLLAHGASKDLKDADDFTPMELAKVSGHEDIIALLQR